MKSELLPDAFTSGTPAWAKLVADTRIDLGGDAESQLVGVMIPSVGTGTYRMVRITASRGELVALCQEAMKSVIQAALQRPFQLTVTGQYDCATASAMPVVGDIVGGSSRGTPTLGFRELAYLLGSHQPLQRALVALSRGAFEADGVMVLEPSSFVPALPPSGCPQWAESAKTSKRGVFAETAVASSPPPQSAY